MKKITAIIGSPRKGDTYAAVQRFEEALKKLEDVEIEYIMLSKLNLADCVGCHNCVIKGRDTCHQAQIIHELQEKIVAADGVILACPVYNQSVTAIMKRFLDYFTFMWHRPELFGVKFFGIASGGGVFDGVFKALKTNAVNWGGSWVGSLGVPHYDALTPKFKQKVDADFAKKAALFLKALEPKELPRPGLGRLIWFNMWKMNAVVCRESNPMDFQHWTEKKWMTSSYYYDTKVNPVKKLIAKLVMGMARMYMHKIYIGY